MGITLKRGADGEVRRWWYGELYRPDGKRTVVNLNVPVEGKPPVSGRVTESGDEAFERSRQRAQSALDEYRREAKQGRMDRSAAFRMYKDRTGSKLVAAPTRALRTVFDGDAVKRTPKWQGFCCRAVIKFADWMDAHKVGTLLDVTVAHAKAFLEELYDPTKPQYTVRTVRGIRSVVAQAFDRLLPEGAPNPLRHMTLKVERARGDIMMHRTPLNEQELARVLEAAKEVDTEAYDWMVCAVSTGLRRGDVCSLEWANVDLKSGSLKVRTHKTGTDLCLPILPLLKGVLIRRKAQDDKGRFVFPEAEKIMRSNSNIITYRVKKVFVAAFTEPTNDEPETKPRKELPDVLEDVLSAVRKLDVTPEKRERMEAVLMMYAEGKSCREINHEKGITRAEVYGLLREAESAAGILFVAKARRTGGHARGPGLAMDAAIAKLTQTKREFGGNAASRYDFHALRTTFVTLAISNGVNMDILRALTGHRTVEMVMRHYFKPKGSDFAEQLKQAMPKVLTCP